MTRSFNWVLLTGALALGACQGSGDQPKSKEPAAEKPATSAAPAQAAASQAPEAASATCGAEGLPDCPTQAWMKANLEDPLEDKAFPKLEEGLRKVASKAKSDYPEWKTIAETGAAAAAKSDLAGVQASCKSCHKQYRKDFQKKYRTETIF